MNGRKKAMKTQKNLQKRLRGLILAAAMLSVGFMAYADTMTVSTYYPSPYGSYQNLDTANTTNLATAGGNVIMAMGGGSVGVATNAPTDIFTVNGFVASSGASAGTRIYDRTGGANSSACVVPPAARSPGRGRWGRRRGVGKTG